MSQAREGSSKEQINGRGRNAHVLLRVHAQTFLFMGNDNDRSIDMSMIRDKSYLSLFFS